MRYESNPKHREPWQPGRKGTLCPLEARDRAEDLLASSLQAPGKPGRRFSTDGEGAYEGKEHAHGAWHGWPIGWMEVPETVRRQWVEERRVQRQSLRRYWRLG